MLSYPQFEFWQLANPLWTDVVDESAALKTEILVLKRRNDILAKKEKRIQGIVTEWGKKVFFTIISDVEYWANCFSVSLKICDDRS